MAENIWDISSLQKKTVVEHVYCRPLYSDYKFSLMQCSLEKLFHNGQAVAQFISFSCATQVSIFNTSVSSVYIPMSFMKLTLPVTDGYVFKIPWNVGL